MSCFGSALTQYRLDAEPGRWVAINCPGCVPCHDRWAASDSTPSGGRRTTPGRTAGGSTRARSSSRTTTRERGSTTSLVSGTGTVGTIPPPHTRASTAVRDDVARQPRLRRRHPRAVRGVSRQPHLSGVRHAGARAEQATARSDAVRCDGGEGSDGARPVLRGAAADHEASPIRPFAHNYSTPAGTSGTRTSPSSGCASPSNKPLRNATRPGRPPELSISPAQCNDRLLDHQTSLAT